MKRFGVLVLILFIFCWLPIIIFLHNYYLPKTMYLHQAEEATEWPRRDETNRYNNRWEGQVPVEVLLKPGLQYRPVVGMTTGNLSFSQSAWITYDLLHGNNIKTICTLHSTLEGPPLTSPASGNPYQVVVRPLKNGGSGEAIAYFLAVELGIDRFPSLAVLPQTLEIESPWFNTTDRVNVQSMVPGVEMVFVKDWTHCFPVRTTRSDSDGTQSPRWFDNGTVRVELQQRLVSTNESAFYRLCPRNMSLYDKVAEECLERPSSLRPCHGAEVVQILEMLMFDALIFNGERLHAEGPSNNVHIVRRVSHNYSDNTPLDFVWLDHGHYSFSDKDKNGETGGEMINWLGMHCIFSVKMLERLFGNATAVAHQGRLSDRVLRRMGPELVAMLDNATWDLNCTNGTRESLAVVERQFERLNRVILQCAAARNGTIDVIQ